MLMANKSSGGISADLYAGDNGSVGIDVYNYVLANATDDAFFKYWYPTPNDNITITGGIFTAAKVTSALIDGVNMLFEWEGQEYWVGNLNAEGYLDLYDSMD